MRGYGRLGMRQAGWIALKAPLATSAAVGAEAWEDPQKGV